MYEDLKKIIDESSHIVFFGGAGVSTESGIPDFRSENGIYKAWDNYGKPPEELISRPFFDRKPDIFYDYYKNNLIYRDAHPNAAHLALAKLEAMGKLDAVVTQNIDGLHQKAGSRNVIEVHGSVLRNNCVSCGAFYDLDYIMDPANCTGHVPHCNKCNGIVKPDVVLYQEALDQNVLSRAISAISNADTLIVGGTSLVVYPAAGFIDHFKGRRLALVNKTETSCDSKADVVIRDSIGIVLGSVV
ncbi:MAG: NAD-dependent protein deacylase [Clostridiales bacterium]|nr:NAD-dependent protein deacylase [Clostridiales bacterium]